MLCQHEKTVDANTESKVTKKLSMIGYFDLTVNSSSPRRPRSLQIPSTSAKQMMWENGHSLSMFSNPWEVVLWNRLWWPMFILMAMVRFVPIADVIWNGSAYRLFRSSSDCLWRSVRLLSPIKSGPEGPLFLHIVQKDGKWKQVLVWCLQRFVFHMPVFSVQYNSITCFHFSSFCTMCRNKCDFKFWN